MMSRADRDLPVHLFNNEGCGLEVSLLSHQEMGGKGKTTLLKTDDQKGQEMDCPAASPGLQLPRADCTWPFHSPTQVSDSCGNKA